MNTTATSTEEPTGHLAGTASEPSGTTLDNHAAAVKADGQEMMSSAPQDHSAVNHRPLSVLHGVEVNVSVEIGRTKATVKDLLALQVGSLIELDRPAGSPVDLLANNALIAKGEVVVIDDEFALRVTQVLEPGSLDGT